MGSPAQAKDACNSLDGTYLIDRCINVSLARPKEEAGPGAKKVAGKGFKSQKPGRGRK
jgi:RNA recognition motif-containing protein